MAFDPQKSREARAETEQVTASPAAASIPQPQNSPARGNCDLRGPQSVVGRSAATDQPVLAEVEYISLGAAAALVVAGVLALLQSKGVLQ